MSETKPMGRQALKRLTKQTIENAYIEAGCFTETKSAGAVNYVAIRLSEDDPFTIANIYGSRTGAASVWLKNEAWESLRSDGHIKQGDRAVIDVESYKRGMDWSIEVHDNVDPIIETIISATMAHGKAHAAQRLAAAELKAEKAEEAKARAAAMAEKRRNPFA